MRLTRLLFAVSLISAASVIAAGQENKTDHQNARRDYVKPFVAPTVPLTKDSPFYVQKRTAPGPYRASDFEGADDITCLVMHTTQVARDSQNSDAVHVVAERNCTPSTRFQMKSAVAEPSLRK